MGKPVLSAPAATPLKMRVEGMDCGVCAVKIENALKRLPGVSEINVNYGVETLTLRIDQDRTSSAAVQQKIRALGYTPRLTDGDAARISSERIGDATAADARPWWQTPKGRRVIAIGTMFVGAFVVSMFVPSISYWAYVFAALIGLAPFARRAFTAAVSGTPFSIEMLMSIAAMGAVMIGAAEEATVVVFLFAIGELLENIAARRARAGIEALMDLVPRVALVERDGRPREVPIEHLSIGDVLLVRPGDRVPSDGEVIDGTSEVDEAPVTGESVAVPKTVGDAVFAGTINANGMLRVRTTRTSQDNTIARIIHLVEEAQGSKAPTARFVDRFSTYYTPAAMAIAGLVVIVPPLLLGADWSTWIYRGLATLLIACPCALVISTPAAIASGLAAGARRGLLIKGGAILELLGKVATVAFDKTGTLTVGKPQVTDVVAIEEPEGSVLGKAAAVERGSNHPLGVAIVAAAESRGLTIPSIFGGSTVTPGKAVQARLRDSFVAVGSPRYASELAPIPPEVSDHILGLESQGKTVVVVLAGKRMAGLIAVRDVPRGDAATGIARLRSLGIKAVMLTGDNQRTANAIAGALAIEVHAGLLPDAKLQAIAALKELGPVAMVGDGINDAPALAAASVGIAMGGGTDVALETADAALLKNRVESVAELVELSRATLRNIWQNITLALGLKGIFLATTLLGVTSLWMAILADTGATVLVTANALRLLRFGSSAPASMV
jgi:Cd2+/Zn2+-exporting ATPase